MSTRPPTPHVPTPARRPRHRRWLMRFLTLFTSAGAVALVAVGGAGTAQADSLDGQPYTADDGCFYFVQDGQWVGGSCMVTYVDAYGTAVDGVYSVHAYDPAAAGHLGRLVLQVDLRDPAYLVYRDPDNPVYDGGVWARQLRGVPTAPVEVTVWDDASNGWRWQALPAVPSASADAGLLGGDGFSNGSTTIGGGGFSNGSTSIGGSWGGSGWPQVAALAANQNGIGTVLAPNCGSDYIWCHD